MMKQAILLLALIAVPLSAAGNCYQILDRGGETIYLERSPPWSLEWPPTDTSARDASRARGEQFIIHRGRSCTDFSASTSSSDPMREIVRQANINAERRPPAPARPAPAQPPKTATAPAQRPQPATTSSTARPPSPTGTGSQSRSVEDPVDVVVRVSQARGIVSNYQLSDIAPSISVRPAFHEMDIEEKRAIAVAFLIHAQRQRPDAGYQFVMIRDSRNNNNVGNYDERLGLRLRRDYR